MIVETCSCCSSWCSTGCLDAWEVGCDWFRGPEGLEFIYITTIREGCCRICCDILFPHDTVDKFFEERMENVRTAGNIRLSASSKVNMLVIRYECAASGVLLSASRLNR